jgi:uncharacterized membrane protein (DUF2068 family)
VAGFEAAKGLIVLAAGLGIFHLVHRDAEEAAERLVRNLHLDVDSHFPRIFIDVAGRLDDSHLRLLAAVALVYSLVRFVEGYGLWRDRRWAEWFGAVSGAVYLPLELYKLWEGITWLRVLILVSNCLVVFYLTQLLVRRQACPPAAANSPVAPVGP